MRKFREWCAIPPQWNNLNITALQWKSNASLDCYSVALWEGVLIRNAMHWRCWQELKKVWTNALLSSASFTRTVQRALLWGFATQVCIGTEPLWNVHLEFVWWIMHCGKLLRVEEYVCSWYLWYVKCAEWDNAVYYSWVEDSACSQYMFTVQFEIMQCRILQSWVLKILPNMCAVWEMQCALPNNAV